MSKCLLCSEEPADAAIMEHLRLMHPDAYGDGPELWPDGSPVIIDATDYTADEVGEGQ